ncbi:MAG: hypothetical protein LBJ90_02705, partial [Treponema sp.]|nr:hypothetical protein [Treponema sp.]
GCSKTSVFGTATLDLHGKADIWPLFQELVSKPTGFWNKLNSLKKVFLTKKFISPKMKYDLWK